MVEINQEIHKLIGSQNAIDALAKKDSARVLVISDSHGSYSALGHIVRTYGKECDALIFCGDGVGDIATLLSNAKVDNEVAASVPPVIAVVQGNNDAGSYAVSSGERIVAPQRQILTVCGKKILIVHGHRQGVDFGYESIAFEAQMTECSIIVHGHTHIAHDGFFGDNNEYRIINPGSCSRPRGGTPPGFAILTISRTFIDSAFVKIEHSSAGASYKIFIPMGL